MNNSRKLVDPKIAQRMHHICEDQWIKEQTARFIVVIHGWFVKCKGFDVHEIEAHDMKEATIKAQELSDEREDDFQHIAFKVIPIYPGETIKKGPRKLSWKERITGRISDE